MTGKPPDPAKGVYVFASGRKGSGKSVVCRAWFDSYPFDRVVIDPTHDLREDFRRDGIEFEELHADALPARLPAYDPQHRKTWIFCPDMGSPTAVDDMDRVVGLALGRGPTLLWCDEFGTLTRANKTPPNTRRLLHHGRHDHLTFLCACPRPMDIDGLAINQADKVYTFRTANPDDLERIAKNIGYDAAEFAQHNKDLTARGPHWHTLYDQATDQLWIMPPLPRKRHGKLPIADPGDLAPLDDAGEADELHGAVRRARQLRGFLRSHDPVDGCPGETGNHVHALLGHPVADCVAHKLVALRVVHRPFQEHRLPGHADPGRLPVHRQTARRALPGNRAGDLPCALTALSPRERPRYVPEVARVDGRRCRRRLLRH
jgi:hypothetical protein